MYKEFWNLIKIVVSGVVSGLITAKIIEKMKK